MFSIKDLSNAFKKVGFGETTPEAPSPQANEFHTPMESTPAAGVIDQTSENNHGSRPSIKRQLVFTKTPTDTPSSSTSTSPVVLLRLINPGSPIAPPTSPLRPNNTGSK